ncbi:MAG: DUF2721 domain-containing protein [Verrucomicrobia bacterium]|nr:DUF2721 domain-containing protein [Verrucomicrobiota bacterium]
MEISITTPALLFPALSLLLLAYTNRFVVLSGLIRNLHERYQASKEVALVEQIYNLRRRVVLIRNMQAAGILSLLLCVVAMMALLAGLDIWGRWIFAVSLVLLTVSLSLSLVEIWVSMEALNMQLGDLAYAGDGKGGIGAGRRSPNAIHERNKARK